MRDAMKKVLKSDRAAFKGIDPVDAVLHLCAKYSFLPEIFDIFGPEMAWKFLSMFGGRTIKVPSDKAVQESLSHLVIWSELSGTHENSKDVIKRLAQRYDMKDSEVRNAAAKVQDMIDEQRRFQDQLAEFAGDREGTDQRPTETVTRKRRRSRAGATDGRPAETQPQNTEEAHLENSDQGQA